MRSNWKTSSSQLNHYSMTSKQTGPPSTIGRTSASYIGRRKYNDFSMWSRTTMDKTSQSRNIGRYIRSARPSAQNVLGSSANALLLDKVTRAQVIYEAATPGAAKDAALVELEKARAAVYKSYSP